MTGVSVLRLHEGGEGGTLFLTEMMVNWLPSKKSSFENTSGFQLTL